MTSKAPPPNLVKPPFYETRSFVFPTTTIGERIPMPAVKPPLASPAASPAPPPPSANGKNG